MNVNYKTIILLVVISYLSVELFSQVETCQPILSTGVFNQADTEWESELLGNQLGNCYGATIGNKGCALTSMAMLFRGHNNNMDVNPENLNDWILNAGFWYNGCNMWWSKMDEYPH